MTISAVFEVPLSFNPTNCHALAGSELTLPCSFHCNLASAPEPALLTSNPNVFTALLLLSFAVNAKNAVLNARFSPPAPITREAWLKSNVVPELKVNVFPIHEQWMDVGYPESLQQARKAFK